MPTITIEIPNEVVTSDVEKMIRRIARRIALELLAQELSLTKEEARWLEEKVREGMREWVVKKVKR